MKKFLILFCIILLMVLFGNYISVEAENNSNLAIYEGPGAINIENDKLVLSYNNKRIILPEYNFYFKNNENSISSYYIADVLKEQTISSQITYFTLLYNEVANKFNNINIHVFETSNNKYFNLTFNLDDICVERIISSSVNFDTIMDEEILDRIKYSISTYSQVQKAIIENNEAEQDTGISTFALGEESISPEYEIVDPGPGGGSSSGDDSSLEAGNLSTVETKHSYNSYNINYDSYTNSDGIINSYESSYLGNYKDENDKITDDQIVQIVPKELFFQQGQHLYIGNEYGFFVRTYIDTLNSADYAVDVVVFDIIKTIPNFTNSTYSGSMKINHLFEFKYRAVDRSHYSSWDAYDPSLDKVVFPHLHYDLIEYYIRNVSFKHSLENETALNYGDNGYDPNVDEGAFFIQTRLNYEGVGLKKYKSEVVADTVSFLFGYVPYSNEATYLANLLKDGDYYETHQSNNEENINTYATNRYYQIEEHGQLIKQLSVVPNQVSEKPMIYGKGNYIESIYVVSYYAEEVPTRYISSVSLEVGVDNTEYYLFGAIQTGEFYTYSSGASYYSSSKKATFNCNSETISSLDYFGDSAYYKFTPSLTGNYVFETTGNTDTYLKLYDSNNNVLAVNDDAGESTNGRIQYSLIKGNTYFIKVQGYNNSKTGDFRFLIMYDIYSSSNLTLDSNTSISIETYGFKLLRFTPTNSGNYTFSTSENSCDPILYLYNSDFVQLAYNDDSSDRNSLINHYLEAGKTYYILSRCYSNGSGTYTLSVKNS